MPSISLYDPLKGQGAKGEKRARLALNESGPKYSLADFKGLVSIGENKRFCCTPGDRSVSGAVPKVLEAGPKHDFLKDGGGNEPR
jgi:hypothetical protein